MSVVSYVTFVLSLFVPHFSLFVLGRVVLRECGISMVYTLIYSHYLKLQGIKIYIRDNGSLKSTKLKFNEHIYITKPILSFF